jgi:hypothetical protein
MMSVFPVARNMIKDGAQTKFLYFCEEITWKRDETSTKVTWVRVSMKMVRVAQKLT